jgi:transposase-like protein
VTDRLPDALASTVAKRMRAAYRNPDPLIAQAELEALARELDRSYRGAAASLLEGLAETLTIRRLGVPPTLARTLRSTNAIELDLPRGGSDTLKTPLSLIGSGPPQGCTADSMETPWPTS